MPKVPYSDNVVPFQPAEPGPSLTEFAMAAALMHQEGRLFALPKDGLEAPRSKADDGH